jgi:hypothetical protein
MLINIDTNMVDMQSAIICQLIYSGKPAIRKIQTGIYETWDISNLIDSLLLDRYPSFGNSFSSYGVCDSIKQLIEKMPPVIKKSKRKFVIGVAYISRVNQSSPGGWRWHKWGPYIGTKKPRHEYLYDDKHIKGVWLYHIVEIR